MAVNFDKYLEFVKDKFEPVNQDRGKLTTAGCIIAQQIDEIDLALQGVLSYDIVDDIGDALFAIAYIASVENLDFKKMVIEAEEKHVVANIDRLKATAISVISACAQYANYTLRKNISPDELFRRHEHTLFVFLIQLAPFLKQEGKKLENAIEKNIEKLS
jgi:hypothetical protein